MERRLVVVENGTNDVVEKLTNRTKVEKGRGVGIGGCQIRSMEST